MAKKWLKYGLRARFSSSLVMLVVRISLFFCRPYTSRAGFLVRNPALLDVWESAVLGQTVDGLMAFVGLLYSDHSAQGEIV